MVESKQLVNLSLQRQLMKKVVVSLKYTYVNWENAGFDSSNPQSEESLADLNKHSLGITLRYKD